MLEAYCAKRRPKERCDGGRCVHDLPSSNISEVSVPLLLCLLGQPRWGRGSHHPEFAPPPPSCTLETYAGAKSLPVEF